MSYTIQYQRAGSQCKSRIHTSSPAEAVNHWNRLSDDPAVSDIEWFENHLVAEMHS